MRRCFLCGRNGNGDPLDKHHIFGGANRPISEKYGLYVYLCRDRCHISGKGAVHQNYKTMQMLHQYGQKKWMDENNGTVEDFIKIFGRSFL